MTNKAIRGGLLKETLENICNNDEEVRRDGITLAKAALTVKLAT